MEKTIDPSRIFTRQQVEDLLSATIGKTLVQVDKAKLFEHHEGRDKVKGIAGDIIEESVLGCKKDSKQEPDILVDGVLTEIKTTGMVEPKKKDSPYLNECKKSVKKDAKHTFSTCIQHSLRETLILCTSRNHYFLCDQSFASLNHKRPNGLRSKTHYRATDCIHVRGLHHSSDSLPSAPS